jgi:hypothetical protein
LQPLPVQTVLLDRILLLKHLRAFSVLLVHIRLMEVLSVRHVLLAFGPPLVLRHVLHALKDSTQWQLVLHRSLLVLVVVLERFPVPGLLFAQIVMVAPGPQRLLLLLRLPVVFVTQVHGLRPELLVVTLVVLGLHLPYLDLFNLIVSHVLEEHGLHLVLPAVITVVVVPFRVLAHLVVFHVLLELLRFRDPPPVPLVCLARGLELHPHHARGVFLVRGLP